MINQSILTCTQQNPGTKQKNQPLRIDFNYNPFFSGSFRSLPCRKKSCYLQCFSLSRLWRLGKVPILGDVKRPWPWRNHLLPKSIPIDQRPKTSWKSRLKAGSCLQLRVFETRFFCCPEIHSSTTSMHLEPKSQKIGGIKAVFRCMRWWNIKHVFRQSMEMCGLSLKENIALRCFKWKIIWSCVYISHIIFIHAAGAFSPGNQPSKQPEAYLKQGNLLEQMRCILSTLLTWTNKHSWLEIHHFHAFP